MHDIPSVKSLISQAPCQRRFVEVLQERAPQFLASLCSQCAAGPLAQLNPGSVIAAAFVAASLDLPIDRHLGFAWIVPYQGEAQVQIGYRGYIQLALRTGWYERINAFPVNVEALGGFDDFGEPVIDFARIEETREAIGYAIVWKLSNGFRKCVYWSRAKVERHARRNSRSFPRGVGSLWYACFDEMALKTVISHGLRKWGVLSFELQQAFRHDQGTQANIDAEVSYPDGMVPEDSLVPKGRIGASPLAAGDSRYGSLPAAGLFDDPAVIPVGIDPAAATPAAGEPFAIVDDWEDEFAPNF
jgi:recombination protein RecT